MWCVCVCERKREAEAEMNMRVKEEKEMAKNVRGVIIFFSLSLSVAAMLYVGKEVCICDIVTPK